MGEIIRNPALMLPRAKATFVNESNPNKCTEYFGWTLEALEGPVPENDYGVPVLANASQYIRELYAYRMGGLGLKWDDETNQWVKHNKLYHMVNAIKLDLPTFKFTAEGYINTECLRVLEACVEQRDLAVAGAASSGKTFPIAAYILQDWKSAPHATLSFVCTTSLGAAEDRIWGTIVKFFQSCRYKVGTLIPHKYMIVFGKFSEDASDRDITAAIKALAIPRGKEGQNAIDTTRGRKQLSMRLVFDELPEMELYVTKAAVNLESNPEGVQVIGIGNPYNPLDAHGQMCRPDHPLGFDSVSKDIPEWKTRTGWCIFLNGEWSFNFQALVNEKIPAKYITNRETLQRMLVRCHGNRESLEYYRNAIGYWPGTAVSLTVLTVDLIKERKCNQKVRWRSTTRKKICGFDTAFTHGGDLCVAQFGEVGEDMQGRSVALWLFEKVYTIPAHGVFEDELAKQVVEDCIKHGVKPDGFGMDISADGGKVLRAIIRYWLTKDPTAAEIAPLSSMERPSDRLVSNVDPRKCSEAFDRRVTEYWMMVREGVLCESIRGLPLAEHDTDLHQMIDELCTRTYSIRGRKFSVETKDDMKERTLGKSPDRADAFCYMIEMARRHGLFFKSPEDEEREEQEKEKEELAHSRSSFDPEAGYERDSWGEDLLAA